MRLIETNPRLVLAVFAVIAVIFLSSVPSASLLQDEGSHSVPVLAFYRALEHGELGELHNFFRENAVAIWALYFYPPLMTIIQIPSVFLLGPSEYSVRLPNALLGIALTAGVYYLGRKFYDENTGLAAALMIAASPFFTSISKIAMLDVLFALALVFYAHYSYKAFNELNGNKKQKQEPAAKPLKAGLPIVAGITLAAVSAYVINAAADLELPREPLFATQNSFALLLASYLLCAIGIYSLWKTLENPEGKSFLAAGIFGGLMLLSNLKALAGLLVAAIPFLLLAKNLVKSPKKLAFNAIVFALALAGIAGPWYVYAIRTGMPATILIPAGQGPTQDFAAHLWYYPNHLMVDYGALFAVILGGIVFAAYAHSNKELFLLAWMFLILGFFALAINLKDPRYIFGAYPPMAILTAAFLVHLQRKIAEPAIGKTIATVAVLAALSIMAVPNASFSLLGVWWGDAPLSQTKSGIDYKTASAELSRLCRDKCSIAAMGGAANEVGPHAFLAEYLIHGDGKISKIKTPWYTIDGPETATPQYIDKFLKRTDPDLLLVYEPFIKKYGLSDFFDKHDRYKPAAKIGAPQAMLRIYKKNA